jgi:hypothetical protein
MKVEVGYCCSECYHSSLPLREGVCPRCGNRTPPIHTVGAGDTIALGVAKRQARRSHWRLWLVILSLAIISSLFGFLTLA